MGVVPSRRSSPMGVVLPPRVETLQQRLDLSRMELVMLMKEIGGDGREWTITVPFSTVQSGRGAFYGQ